MTRIEQDIDALGLTKAFGFAESEKAIVEKMLREYSTDEIMKQMAITRQELAQKRREITIKLGLLEEAASDNTIVKTVLEWLYLEEVDMDEHDIG